MGFVADLVSGIFGGGRSETPTVAKTDPVPTSVSDANGDTGKDTIATKRKKKSGYKGDMMDTGSIAATAAKPAAEEEKRTTLA